MKEDQTSSNGRRSTRVPRAESNEKKETRSKLAKGIRTGSNRTSSNSSSSKKGTSESHDEKKTDKKKQTDSSPDISQANHDKNTKKHADSTQKDATEGQSEPSHGAGNTIKNQAAKATGVDYSDKNLKDQLEHQAADVVMDATPGLGQFNSARKALKDVNETKKQLGHEKDDMADKAEEKMDDAVDAGIKGTKIVAGAGAAGSAGFLGMTGLLMMKAMLLLKGALLAAAGKIAGFFGAMFSAMSSFVSGALGVATAAGQAITATLMATMVTITSFLGFGAFQEMDKKDDSEAACVPSQTSVPSSSQNYVNNGDVDAIREDHAVKLWSVYSEVGGTKEQTAAVLGNLQAESSLDPTAVETIYDEPFSIGPRKQSAIAYDFEVDSIDPEYGHRFEAIDHVGIGLAQWTNERNRLLVQYAQEQQVNWYDFDTQVRFMLEGDSPGRQEQLTSFLNADTQTVESETEQFMNTWIGLSSPNASLSNRQTNATNFMFTLERATADTDYADGILSGINVNRSEGNQSAGSYHQDDGCGNPIKTHYGNQAVDGTGEVPANLTLVPWSRETLPSSLEAFAKNPADAGLTWGGATGWTNGILPDQCAALSHSYFIQLYPAWNENGRPTERPYGDGKDVAKKWADHYNQEVTDYPSSGAVFSDATTSEFGHTGVVQHVFANGDILVNEQNIRGVSGAGAGLDYSWSWRVIKKERYESANWTFFKPADADPQWTTPNV